MSVMRYCLVDYHNPTHCLELIRLLNLYREDPMGAVPRMSKKEGEMLIEGLRKTPSAITLLVFKGVQAVGMANGFVNFSTFQLAPYLNIHDVCIDPAYRKEGLGRFLMESLEEIARNKSCCRINLEVRDDNIAAQTLYRSLGFQACKPNMFFWEKRF